jgi:lactate dehydrogenase-like 2-hydroxyacid dehydrogenase
MNILLVQILIQTILLKKQTKYLINDYSISKMKDGVMIINTGRGQSKDNAGR